MTHKRFAAILSGFTERNTRFFSYVREGDEQGTCIQEDDPGFLELAQEIAEFDLPTRRWLEGYQPEPVPLVFDDEW